MPRIRISPRASSDLTEIWSYIADDSVENADSFVDKIHKVIQTLATRPGSGRLREELTPGILSFPFGRYVIFYNAIKGGVKIVRVLHGARDIQNIFKGS
jgi:toxin ParE1/3/4